MGYTKSKTTERDKISGHHVHVDVQDGSHSVDQLRARAAARLNELTANIAADSGKPMQTQSEASHPSLGDAFSRLPKRAEGGKAPAGEPFGIAKGTNANPGDSSNDRPKEKKKAS